MRAGGGGLLLARVCYCYCYCCSSCANKLICQGPSMEKRRWCVRIGRAVVPPCAGLSREGGREGRGAVVRGHLGYCSALLNKGNVARMTME